MSRLRSYAPMKRQSDKVKKGAPDFKAVYAEVDARSEGRCEVTERVEVGRANGELRHRYEDRRCPRRGVEHDHLFKPRRSHHTANEVVYICRGHHDRKAWPYVRGRLVYLGRMDGAFLFVLRYAASKFEARGQGA